MVLYKFKDLICDCWLRTKSSIRVVVSVPGTSSSSSRSRGCSVFIATLRTSTAVTRAAAAASLHSCWIWHVNTHWLLYLALPHSAVTIPSIVHEGADGAGFFFVCLFCFCFFHIKREEKVPFSQLIFFLPAICHCYYSRPRDDQVKGHHNSKNLKGRRPSGRVLIGVKWMPEQKLRTMLQAEVNSPSFNKSSMMWSWPWTLTSVEQ